ncbi:2-succinyl-6-hydroxy-2,4-cyclohexadiene-1-carboxylate synthase [Agrilactobacillus yilanensis]|uniref:Putative 2-succinyl-6-hydroxy-2,4-cyclohexadiene-1-carboxylate synthase n=1 Tax=Agrilactobacillus yilanensis TaxID=2485997 RepID=A0ABW4JAX9_9LACO|nr:2-succinyl-6-hydroxy-2,4-cyclohexadiene-1-carboxylate synthase [Agrilactobacillus yilanensis]
MQLSLHNRHYFFTKTGTTQPIWLLLHGFMGSHQDFEKLAQQLPGTVICPDLLGHGATTAPLTQPFTMAQQVADLTQLLDTLVGSKPVNVVGYSMGGRIALGLSVQQPQRIQRLYLESSRPGLATTAQRQQRQIHDAQLIQKLKTVSLAEFVADWANLPLFDSQKALPAAIYQQIQRQRRQQDPLALAKSLQDLGTGRQPNYWPKLAQLPCPTTIITGALDQKFTKIGLEMAALIPNSQHVVIANVGHNTHLEAPAKFLQILTAGGDFSRGTH